MSVDRASAPAQVDWHGQMLYFCAKGCRDEFLAAPEQFSPKQAS
jgi:YHS domain-containing protein